MQMLGNSSEEGERAGLGWIDGRVRGLRALDTSGELQLPQMGWNDVCPVNENPLFCNIDEEWRFYFLHSFYFECARAQDVGAVAQYGKESACAVRSGNVLGVQFHPAKSYHFGTTLLKTLATL